MPVSRSLAFWLGLLGDGNDDFLNVAGVLPSAENLVEKSLLEEGGLPGPVDGAANV